MKSGAACRPCWLGLELDHVEFARQHYTLGLPVAYPFMAWRSVIPLYHERRAGWLHHQRRLVADAEEIRHAGAPPSPGSAAAWQRRHHRSGCQSLPPSAFEAKVAKLPFFNPPRKRL